MQFQTIVRGGCDCGGGGGIGCGGGGGRGIGCGCGGSIGEDCSDDLVAQSPTSIWLHPHELDVCAG